MVNQQNLFYRNLNSKSFLLDYHNSITLGYPKYIKSIQLINYNPFWDSLKSDQYLRKQQDYIYFPPELLLRGQLTLKNDIWSLGILIYESLFGLLPWNNKKYQSPFQMGMTMISQKINLTLQEHISKTMKHFLMNCLQIEFTKRFGWQQILEHDLLNKQSMMLQQKNSDTQENLNQNQIKFFTPIILSKQLPHQQFQHQIAQ